MKNMSTYADIGNSYLGNSTYMKVVLKKNLTSIIIIYNTKFQFAKVYNRACTVKFSEPLAL